MGRNMNSIRLGVLKNSHPWPSTPPNVPEDWHGWLHGDTAAALTSRLGPQTRCVVECGSWLGLSARAILTAAPNATLVCIDTWQGSPEHQPDRGMEDWFKRLPTLRDTFLKNLWPWRERVIPIQADSLVGLGKVYAAGVVPDLIYLDTKHTFCRVSAELYTCLELWPEVPIVGDDFSHTWVADAAREHSKLTGRPLCEHGAAFSMDPHRNV